MSDKRTLFPNPYKIPERKILLESVKLDVNTLEIDPIKFEVMLTNECERDIQLELNRNYLKSFPARLKFCHIVSGFCLIELFICLLISIIDLITSIHLHFIQFLGCLSSWLLLYLTSQYYWLTFMPICIESILALCSLVFLVSSTINWKTNGKIRMARINFVSKNHLL